jgi:glycosyltransferase involved in cell wall biosynthesis
VLPNAVDPEQFHYQPQVFNSAPDGKFTIGFVGSLKPWHGVDQLISAFASLWEYGSAWQLLIAGDGPDMHRLRAQVAALPATIASSIEFLGIMPHPEIPRLLATLNAGVAPLSAAGDAYFSPLKLFEYMAAGVPIVAARFGQVPSLIRHGVTGLLYNPGDLRELAKALLRLKADPRWASGMGERARREVFAHHTWDLRCDSIVRIVQRSALSHVQIAN